MQTRLLYSAQLSIKIEGEIRTFPNKRSLKEYTYTKPFLQEMLKGLLSGKEGKQRERERNTGTKKWQCISTYQ